MKKEFRKVLESVIAGEVVETVPTDIQTPEAVPPMVEPEQHMDTNGVVVPATTTSPEAIRSSPINPEMLEFQFMKGIDLLKRINDTCNALPFFVDFEKNEVQLLFPSSNRIESFTFKEVDDLLAAMPPPKEKKSKKSTSSPMSVEEDEEQTIGATTSTSGTEPKKDTKGDENNEQFQAALDKAQSLLSTPDQKLAQISKETGIDLLAAKKDAANTVKSVNTQVVTDLKKAAASLKTPAV